jgi:hypothetical protein
MIEASCHCGAVGFEIDAAPAKVTDCHCSHCRKRGALWAYYSPAQVRVRAAEGATSVYLCNDRDIAFHICRGCGCSTHWSALDPSIDRMAVNARLMEPDVLAEATVVVSPGPRAAG